MEIIGSFRDSRDGVSFSMYMRGLYWVDFRRICIGKSSVGWSDLQWSWYIRRQRRLLLASQACVRSYRMSGL
jgi:hypothetical protein